MHAPSGKESAMSKMPYLIILLVIAISPGDFADKDADCRLVAIGFRI
jgi:hypothetical protein